MSYIDDDNLWKENLYETLGVAEDVSESELKKTYLKLAKKYHPDRFPEENEEKIEAQRIFSKITVAYNVLSDPQKKKHYLELRRLLAGHIPQENKLAQEIQQQPSTTPTPSTNTEQKQSEVKPQVQNDPTQTTEKIKEDQARKFFDLGMDLIKKNKIDDAIEQFKKAITTKADVGDFHTQLGNAYRKKNWTGMAINEFKLAMKYNPKDFSAKKALEEMGSNTAKSPEKEEKKGGFLSGLFGFGKKK